MAVANTLAYYITATITAVKSFIVQAPGYILIATRNQWLILLSKISLFFKFSQAYIKKGPKFEGSHICA